MPDRRIATAFPGLKSVGFRVTSPLEIDYNCVAWAADDTTRCWWPDARHYWPPGLPKEDTLDAMERGFELLGYTRCAEANFEPGFEKVAFFADADGRPKHAARQLPNGMWTSKLGGWEDIEHELHGLSGVHYGRVARLMKRPR
jgi:hypothetical protein